ncbi:MAG: hypothetical protein LPK19_05515, partial [Hymenobacteraceae bacterium]|nr:hypothetical protein [Hymenobacteraceae bacterium]MDX5395659.1 hypothetical protein [Hymenobacteraceae bacterium]MDX5511712.1 hypothetical protein [Hymenobacteraceae bacterium]
EVVLSLSPEGLDGVRYQKKFAYNAKPDAGKNFTAHPFLKLLQPADRPVLDKLLQPFNLQPEALANVLELTQHRNRLQLQHNGQTFLTIANDQVSSELTPSRFFELSLELQQPVLANASPEERAAMEQAYNNLTAALEKDFPELRPDQLPKYNKMYSLLMQKPETSFSSFFAWFGLTALFVIVISIIIRQHRKRRSYTPAESIF